RRLAQGGNANRASQIVQLVDERLFERNAMFAAGTCLFVLDFAGYVDPVAAGSPSRPVDLIDEFVHARFELRDWHEPLDGDCQEELTAPGGPEAAAKSGAS